MKRLFQINIFILLFVLTGSDATVCNNFSVFNRDRIELVENRESQFSNSFEITNLTPSYSKQYSSTILVFADIDIQLIIKYQTFLYRNIRNRLEAIFIISHQANFLPQNKG